MQVEGWLSQSAFVRGFIDDLWRAQATGISLDQSQSAFVRGFIDDLAMGLMGLDEIGVSQSAFVRGFIDDHDDLTLKEAARIVSIRVRARLHR